MLLRRFLVVSFLAALFVAAAPSSAQAQLAEGDACDTNAECVEWLGSQYSCMHDTQDKRKECCHTVWGCVGPDQVAAGTGLGDEDPRVIISQIINVILGFLGIIAVILILAGGFMWMTAAGNDDQIVRAKKTITAGVIGLVIVLAAFGLAQFAVNALVDATTA